MSAATITVTNVAPSVDEILASDPTGRLLGVDTPHALVGLDVTLEATFSDPGVTDTQTAVVDWGDGTIESDSTFAAEDLEATLVHLTSGGPGRRAPNLTDAGLAAA